MKPKYEFPRLPLARLGIDLLLGRRRSFAADSRLVMAANPFPRRVEGLEHVPAEGSFILVTNHFNREGLRPYHCAMVVSAALEQRRPRGPEVRWAFTSELYGRHIVGPVPAPLPVIRWVFRRIGLVYHLIVLPRREERAMGRAAALRHLGRALAAAPVGLTPEGAGSGRLQAPPAGVGLFLAALSRGRVPLLPAGLWEEEDDTLVARFGEPFLLDVAGAGTREQRDRAARDRVMTAIARLLPEAWRGAYATSGVPPGG